MAEKTYLDEVYEDLRKVYGKLGLHSDVQLPDELFDLLYGILGRLEIIEKKQERNWDAYISHLANHLPPR